MLSKSQVSLLKHCPVGLSAKAADKRKCRRSKLSADFESCASFGNPAHLLFSLTFLVGGLMSWHAILPILIGLIPRGAPGSPTQCLHGGSTILPTSSVGIVCMGFL